MRSWSGLRSAVLAFLVAGMLGGAATAWSAESPLWSDTAPSAIASTGERWIQPDPVEFRTMSANYTALAALLTRAPLEETARVEDRVTIELPLPDGSFGRFSIVESPVMAPGLQSAFPHIRTYVGYGLDDRSAHLRCDLTPFGFHAQIRGANPEVYIDPVQRGDVTHYESYYKRDFHSDKYMSCSVVDEDGMANQIQSIIATSTPIVGTQLRTYRLALAADGEYTQYFGGTVAQALAAMVTTMARVNGVYETEVSIRMIMVPNDTLIIFTNPSTDPYTNSDGSAMLAQNQTTCDGIIGNANYDIGHVFSTGGGGIAGLGVVCRTGRKAYGVTGSPSPHGDGYDIDYVAHEMGHEYGGDHNFNSVSGSCSGNRVAAQAFEVGSASTIMGYAGICPPDNLQPHSDAYFGWESIKQIVAYTVGGQGNTCAVITPTGVTLPSVTRGFGNGLTLPRSTPFILNCTATTYGSPTFFWEEADLGPSGHPNTPSGNAPILRPWTPVPVTWRSFPVVDTLLHNRHPFGELLPGYTRSLTFHVTVRDIQAGGVGVAWDTLAMAVDSLSGPFVVTYPDSVASWITGHSYTVTWNVANTNVAPVNCHSVNILLSVDGGHNWPDTLATGVPNNGSYLVTVPDNAATTTARVKVEAADHVFFDFSNLNWPILQATDVTTRGNTSSGVQLLGSRPNPMSRTTTISFALPRDGTVTLRLYDAAGRLVRTLADGEMSAGNHDSVWDGKDATGRAVSSGVYLYRLVSGGEAHTGRITLLK